MTLTEDDKHLIKVSIYYPGSMPPYHLKDKRLYADSFSLERSRFVISDSVCETGLCSGARVTARVTARVAARVTDKQMRTYCL
jgi:hypothetical protein